jgi:hypothetical protein
MPIWKKLGRRPAETRSPSRFSRRLDATSDGEVVRGWRRDLGGDGRVWHGAAGVEAGVFLGSGGRLLKILNGQVYSSDS